MSRLVGSVAIAWCSEKKGRKKEGWPASRLALLPPAPAARARPRAAAPPPTPHPHPPTPPTPLTRRRGVVRRDVGGRRLARRGGRHGGGEGAAGEEGGRWAWAAGRGAALPGAPAPIPPSLTGTASPAAGPPRATPPRRARRSPWRGVEAVLADALATPAARHGGHAIRAQAPPAHRVCAPRPGAGRWVAGGWSGRDVCHGMAPIQSPPSRPSFRRRAVDRGRSCRAGRPRARCA
jgi:hypothetical protein